MTLTPHQLRLLATKAALGLSYKGVALRFRISPRTVRNTFWLLRRTIGARTNAHAVALLWPLIEPLVTERTVANRGY